MRFISIASSRCGAVLFSTLIIGLLVGIVVAALVLVSQQQNYMTARLQTWCGEIPLAEAGIEEALAHLNSTPTNLAMNGWTKSGSNYVKAATLGENGGYYYAAFSTASPPVIVSIGYGRIPKQTNFTHRTVVVTTKRNFAGNGVIAKGAIGLSGGAYVDSFDSRISPTYTNTMRLDHVLVATLSSANPAINSTGGGAIYGSAATGVGGTVTSSGPIGDGTWDASNSGIQPGHVTDDFNMAIPDVTLPGDWASSPLSVPAANPLGQYVMVTGDYTYSGNLSIPGGKSMLISGPGRVRIYVTGSFTTSGSGFIQLAAGASLELYLGGSGTISGGGIVNGTQNAANCAIYGLPTCTTMTYSGSAQYIGTVYTPEADFTFSGGQGASGSFVANTITMSGSSGVHYDEALGRPTAPYMVTSWQEL